MICYLFPDPIYLFYSSDVPSLLYYAYVPITLITIFIGFYVFFNGKHLLLNRLFLAISFLLASWTMSTLILWTNIHSNFMLFVWSFAGLILSLLAIFCIYFIYVFFEKKDIPVWLKIVFIILLAPVLFLTPTSFNLHGFNITNCDAFEFWGITFKLYYTFLNMLAIFSILFMMIRKYKSALSEFKRQILLMGVGIELFLLLFFSITSLIYYLTEIGILLDSRLEMYGVIGIAILMVCISILIVRFKIFNIKLIATQALIWGLVVLIGSQFFFIKVTTNFILNGITFVISIVLGYFLIKSVKKEVEQREELNKLNINLQDLLKQRESLVHLITHKVKGSFTRSKYIFAGMLDGMFGEINDEIKKRAQQGIESDNGGIETVDLVLNAANLQKGIVKYEMKPLNFKELVEKVISDKKILVETRGLKLEKNIGEDLFNLNGDAFWLKEVVNNLIENAIRYTKEGKIEVGLSKKEDKILFYVKDTGIGITEEDKKNLFTEGGRGKDSVKVNVDSTGYGLYSVRLIVDAHKGRVWMEPNGESSGSIFYVELNQA